MVLFAVSVGCRNIWFGPEDRHCKVHNGLTFITCPSARRAVVEQDLSKAGAANDAELVLCQHTIVG